MSGRPDHHRPRYHPRPPKGYLNDPNGPIVVGGLTHLYFQSRPTTDMSVPVEWGHLTSDDLVHWRLHRPAMAPAPDGLDRDGCWSGNTVLDAGRVRAFYSGLLECSPYQSVLTCVSDDGGHSFGPPSRVVPDPAPEEGAIMFRDPFVWAVEGGWQMVVGAGYADGRSAVRSYASPDLQQWRRLDDIASLPFQPGDGPLAGDAWECPQVVDLGDHEVAVFGTWSERGGVNTVVSTVLGQGSTRLAVVDHGTNFYAASVLRDSGHGPVMFGWATEGRPQEQWREAGWAGALTLARRIWLGPDHSVRSEPVATLTTLRADAGAAADGCTVGAQFEVLVPAPSARVELAFSATERLVVELGSDTISVDRSEASNRSGVHTAGASVDDAYDETSGRPAARIFVDGSLVEVFTSAGRALTTRVYPTTPPPWRVEASLGCTVFALDAGRKPSG